LDCGKAHITHRKRLYHTLIWALSEHEKGSFATLENVFRMAVNRKSLTDRHLRKASKTCVFVAESLPARFYGRYNELTMYIYSFPIWRLHKYTIPFLDRLGLN